MDINWDKCIICQVKPDLKCPLDSLKANSEAFYSSFLNNVEEFRRIDSFPTNLHFGIDQKGKCIVEEEHLASVKRWTSHFACFVKRD